jgi:hypothetical protein
LPLRWSTPPYLNAPNRARGESRLRSAQVVVPTASTRSPARPTLQASRKPLSRAKWTARRSRRDQNSSLARRLPDSAHKHRVAGRSPRLEPSIAFAWLMERRRRLAHKVLASEPGRCKVLALASITSARDGLGPATGLAS